MMLRLQFITIEGPSDYIVTDEVGAKVWLHSLMPSERTTIWRKPEETEEEQRKAGGVELSRKKGLLLMKPTFNTITHGNSAVFDNKHVKEIGKALRWKRAKP